jgi:hypothetical protein
MCSVTEHKYVQNFNNMLLLLLLLLLLIVVVVVVVLYYFNNIGLQVPPNYMSQCHQLSLINRYVPYNMILMDLIFFFFLQFCICENLANAEITFGPLRFNFEQDLLYIVWKSESRDFSIHTHTYIGTLVWSLDPKLVKNGCWT